MSDPFDGATTGLESPALQLAPVVPNDSTDLVTPSRALAVSQSGLVQITTITGQTGTVFVAAGVPFPIRVRRVWASGTTASGIVALW